MSVSSSIVVDTLSSHVITFSTTPQLIPSVARVRTSLLGLWAANPFYFSIHLLLWVEIVLLDLLGETFSNDGRSKT